nr:Transporter [Haemonchus contortus]
MAFYYFGLSFLSVDLSDDRFTAYMLSAFVELPGGLVVLPLMMYAGRRTLCLLSMVSQGIFVIVAPFFKNNLWFTQRLQPEYVKFAAVGVLCIIAGALCMFLPETMDRPLPADIKDLTNNTDRVTDDSDTQESHRSGIRENKPKFVDFPGTRFEVLFYPSIRLYSSGYDRDAVGSN